MLDRVSRVVLSVVVAFLLCPLVVIGALAFTEEPASPKVTAESINIAGGARR